MSKEITVAILMLICLGFLWIRDSSYIEEKRKQQQMHQNALLKVAEDFSFVTETRNQPARVCWLGTLTQHGQFSNGDLSNPTQFAVCKAHFLSQPETAFQSIPHQLVGSGSTGHAEDAISSTDGH